MSASTTAPAFRSPVAPHVASMAHGLRRPLALAAGDLLRLVDAPGTRIVATSGVLWITEERSPTDVVLRRGGSHRIGECGVTLVEAHRPSRIAIEVPHVARAPASVELAFADGRGGRIVRLRAEGARAWGERVRDFVAHALRLVKPSPTLYGRYEGRPMPRTRSGSRFDPSEYTPEAVRDRLLRTSQLPYF